MDSDVAMKAADATPAAAAAASSASTAAASSAAAPAAKSSKSSPSESLPWVEKYRPSSLDEVISQSDILRTVEKLVDSGQLPHLLFYGPPGTGPRTSRNTRAEAGERKTRGMKHEEQRASKSLTLLSPVRLVLLRFPCFFQARRARFWLWLARSMDPNFSRWCSR